MRINFQNSTRPKKAAKAICFATGKKLADCQQALAKSCGYRDWHDLETSFLPLANESSFELRGDNFNAMIETSLVTAIAKALDANAGDVQHSLAASHFWGNRSANLLEAIDVRRRAFEVVEILPASRRNQGAVGKLKTPGRNGEIVILRNFDQVTRVINHKTADMSVADFEYVSPKQPLPLFIPMRLYLAYGFWTEADGAKVLFSRDYKPLWRIREGKSPERVFPWLRIDHVEETWFWDGKTPWSHPKIYELEMRRLEKFGIRSLPMLVEALPIVIRNDKISDFKDAVPILEQLYNSRSK